jgi:hypothetical protein
MQYIDTVTISFDHPLHPRDLASDTLHSPENLFLGLLIHFLYTYPVHVSVNKNLDALDHSSPGYLRIGMNPQRGIERAGHWKKNEKKGQNKIYQRYTLLIAGMTLQRRDRVPAGYAASNCQQVA